MTYKKKIVVVFNDNKDYDLIIDGARNSRENLSQYLLKSGLIRAGEINN